MKMPAIKVMNPTVTQFIGCEIRSKLINFGI